MSSKKILVTGANGQLGSEFRELEKQYPQYQYLFVDYEELRIEDDVAVTKYFQTHNPFACVNCAAYTAVDKAETEKDKSALTNAAAVGTLANACHQFNALFIHISTDYVFDGNSSIPYKEESVTNPVNHYGYTKLLGEQLALEKNLNTIIIRTAWVYSSFGNNFVKTMMRLMKERESINVVNDQIGSPTYAADLAEAIMKILKMIDGRSTAIDHGIFHYSNEGQISWYEFAVAIKELTGSSCKVNPISTDRYPTPAKRPQYSLLDKSKIKAAYGIRIPDWRASLHRCMERLLRTP